MLESLDSTILLGFVEEAQSYLPDVRRGISFPGAQTEDVQLAYRRTHTIKGAALMVGLPEMSELSGEIEAALEDCLSDEKSFTIELADRLNTALDELEGLLAETVAALRADVNSDADFAEINFDNFAETPETEFSFDAATAETATDEELDPEMLEVFALEAEDLLRNIGENLQTLENAPQDAAALQEIRRSSHTLKGAAGVCGFRTVSRIAHRMEDLLDFLADNPAASNAETTALILATTDLLERLTRGASEADLKSEIERVNVRFEQILSLLERQTGFVSPAKNYETRTFEPTNATSIRQTFDRAPAYQMPSPITQNIGANEIGVVSEKSVVAAHNVEPQHAVAVKKAVVRVGLDRLDDLVKLIGELVINRNTFEQRITQIETQLAELNRSTSRLRRIAGRFEIDYEASTLVGSNRPNAAFAPQVLAKNLPAFAAASVNNLDAQEFDELEFDRYTEFHQLTRELAETSSDTAGIAGELDDLVGNLEVVLTRQRRTTEDMQTKLMRLRMVPFGSFAARLERTVRVTAEQEKKVADFVLEGTEIELDTQVLDSLAEPLLHLLRNAVAHGIESPEERSAAEKSERGTIRLAGHHEGTHIVISISDDGRGINTERLREKAVASGFLTPEQAASISEEEAAQLVFLPGLSTAKTVSEVSGRGVGMDIVRESVERQQGTISLKSKSGEGTTITIRLPVSLAVTRALMVKAFGKMFAVPVGMIAQLTEVTETDFESDAPEKSVVINGKSYAVFSLNALLGLPELVERDSVYIPTILVNSGENQFAITFDNTIDAREIVIKPFDNMLRKVRGLLGATILGDGSVVPILDLFALINRAAKQNLLGNAIEQRVAKPSVERLCVMIVDDSPSVRRVMTNLIAKTGWDALAAKDGLEALEMLQTARQLPHVILSDVEMPRMDGYEFVATLKQQEALRQIPVAMITSRAGEKHRRKALDMGVAEYITKPYQDSFLLETIKRLAD